MEHRRPEGENHRAHHPGRSYNILLRRRPAAQQRHLSRLTAKRARYGRAPGDNMPSDAFLDDFGVYPVVAFALHHALQYHWKGGTCAALASARLMVSSCWSYCPLWTRRACPTTYPRAELM
jgi:hypothetical protein